MTSRGLGRVEVRLQVRKALQHRLHLRQPAAKLAGDRHQLGVRRLLEPIETDDHRLAAFLDDTIGEQCSVHAAVPHRDVDRRVLARSGQRDLAGRPDVRLVDLVRRQVRRVGLHEHRFQRDRRRKPVLRTDDRRGEVGRQRARLVHDRLQPLAHAADDQRLAGELGRGLDFLHFVLHDVERHLVERLADHLPDFLPIRVADPRADFPLGHDHRAQRQPGQQLVRRLLLERAHAVDAQHRIVVAALEIVELRERALIATLDCLVGNLVLRQHRVDVGAKLRRERLELPVVAKKVLDLAVDRVVEPRQVGSLLDALLGAGPGRTWGRRPAQRARTQGYGAASTSHPRGGES